MTSEALKLAKLQARAQALDAFVKLATHPVFSVVLGFVVIEGLQKVYIGEKKEPLIGNNVGTMLEGGLIVTPFMTALATSGTLKELINTGGKGIESLTKLAPLLAAI